MDRKVIFREIIRRVVIMFEQQNLNMKNYNLNFLSTRTHIAILVIKNAYFPFHIYLATSTECRLASGGAIC